MSKKKKPAKATLYTFTNNLKDEKKTGRVVINSEKLNFAKMAIRAFDHPLRKRILETLNPSKRLDVTTIYKKLKLEQSVASQHLAILRRANLVNTHRTGKHIYYSICVEGLNNLDKATDCFFK